VAAHATGLLFVTLLFAVVQPRAVLAASALAIPLIALVGATLAARLPRRIEPAALRGS